MSDISNHISFDDNIKKLVNLIASSPTDFEHLQIFLQCERTCESHKDYEFLLVSPTVFGKVQLLDVIVKDHHAILEILDCSTQSVGNVQIDITNNRPQTFFIRWSDIRKMVLEESTSEFNSDDLLEFEFE